MKILTKSIFPKLIYESKALLKQIFFLVGDGVGAKVVKKNTKYRHIITLNASKVMRKILQAKLQ